MAITRRLAARLVQTTEPASMMLPAQRLDLGHLVCKPFCSDTSHLSSRVGTLDDWTGGAEVYRVKNMLYIPEHGLPICSGYCPEEAIGYPVHLDLRVRRPNPDSKGQLQVVIPETEIVDDEVAILGNVFSYAFGHWLEELFKVVMLESFRFCGKYVVPSHYPPAYFESLCLLGIPERRVLRVEKPMRFSRALLTSRVTLLDINSRPGIALRLRNLLFEAVGTSQDRPERIWAVRGISAHGRNVINEDEVRACASRHGLVPTDYATLSFRDQILMDRSLQLLAGPHGSAILHSAFMPERSNVVEIMSPRYVNTSYPFCLILRQKYHQIVHLHTSRAEYPYGEDIYVNIPHLDLVLSGI